MSVYVSTFCIANHADGGEVFKSLAQAGLKNIELGSRAIPENDTSFKVLDYGFDLIAHNYFLQPSEPIILNLASQNSTILRRSREYIKKTIDFCHRAGIYLLTVHAGFRADPDLKLKFDREEKIPPYKKSFDTFVESLKTINDYAEQKNIKIGVENNVLSEANLVNGKNRFLLLCETAEFAELWQKLPSANLGMLLDLGHLKVTARSLKFDRYKFIESVKNKVFALHVHDNDERVDEHKALDRTSWCFDIITRPHFRGLPIVLESLGLTVKEAAAQVRLIEGALEKRS